ncbi:MAG: LapA family protein [Rhodospirillaceae bacterium]
MSIRRVLVIIGSMLALLFVSQNLDMVEISLVIGRPVEAPLAAVIGIAFLAGFLAGIGVILERQFRRKRNAVTDEEEHGLIE